MTGGRRVWSDYALRPADQTTDWRGFRCSFGLRLPPEECPGDLLSPCLDPGWRPLWELLVDQPVGKPTGNA
eukprot:3689898-Heterocapsa_arctica.AAC.1